MKYIFLILTIASTTAFAQGDETSVKATVNRLFAGMKKSDTAIIRAAFSSTAILQTIATSTTGQIQIMTEPLDSFLVEISKPHADVYDERITFDVVKIDGELATVWAPYKFYVGERLNHCGVDSFQLVKVNGEWKIQYLIDTRRRQGCN
jgi:hypothetical protein